MPRLNRKILCFVDECGTAGESGFALGCVMAWARDCGRADKALSDLLEPNVNELHAADLTAEYLQGLLGRYAQTARPGGVIMMNRLGRATEGSRPALYAQDVIETVKVAIGQFRKENRIADPIRNVELILDQNHHNTDAEFRTLLSAAQENDGRFRAVNRVQQIDSAASRLLQLADIVAYSRSWIRQGEANAAGLRRNYGIRVL